MNVKTYIIRWVIGNNFLQYLRSLNIKNWKIIYNYIHRCNTFLFSEAIFDFKQYAVSAHHTTLSSLGTSIKKVDSPLMNSFLL